MMDPKRDYIVLFPPEGISAINGLELNGGRNVIAKSGLIRFDTDFGTSKGNRAIFIKGNPAQTVPRVVHLEGVLCDGVLRELINVDSQSEPGLDVRLQNVMAATELIGSRDTNHADFFQCYNGPRNLRVDRCYAKTQYQGFMFQPRQFGNSPIGTYEIRRTLIEGTDTAGAIGYLVGGPESDRPKIVTEDFWVCPAPSKAWPGQVLYENPSWWGDGVIRVPRGYQKPVSGDPGLNYVSPGYET